MAKRKKSSRKRKSTIKLPLSVFANYHYGDKAVPCFRGGATVVVKAKPGASGKIRVKAESDGMTSAEASVQAVPGSIPKWK